MEISKKYKEKYKLLSDEKYLKRLAEYVEENSYLDSDGIYLNHEGFTTNDYLNLFDLFNELVEYAMEMYIYPKSKEFDTYLEVKINDKLYQIGCMCGQGNFVYVTKPDSVPNEDEVVDISDLSKISYRAEEIESALKEISDFIDYKRKDINIPSKAISNMFREYISKM